MASNDRGLHGFPFLFCQGSVHSHDLIVSDVGLAVYAYCLPFDTTRSASQRIDFGAQYTALSFPCERFDLTVAHQDASLEAKAIGEILPCTKLAFATILLLVLAHLDPRPNEWFWFPLGLPQWDQQLQATYANRLKEALLPACPDGSNDSIARRQELNNPI